MSLREWRAYSAQLLTTDAPSPSGTGLTFSHPGLRPCDHGVSIYARVSIPIRDLGRCGNRLLFRTESTTILSAIHRSSLPDPLIQLSTSFKPALQDEYSLPCYEDECRRTNFHASTEGHMRSKSERQSSQINRTAAVIITAADQRRKRTVSSRVRNFGLS
jgi:hypothetical protein